MTATVAALFLIPVFTSDPGRLPEPLRRLYQQPGGPGGNTDPGAAADRARARFSAYQDSGQLPLLWEALTLFRAAVTATPAGHPDRAGYLSGLGGAMLKLAERTGDAGLLEQAVRTHRAAAAAAPPVIPTVPPSSPISAPRCKNWASAPGTPPRCRKRRRRARKQQTLPPSVIPFTPCA